jgi:hypothetical protein
MERFPSWLAFVFFLPLFAVFWTQLLRNLSKLGWEALAARYAFDGILPLDASRFNWQTLSIGQGFWAVQYNGSINVWIGRSHVYLRPTLLFRWYSPMLRLPFSELYDLFEHRVFLSKGCRFSVRGTDKPVTLFGRSGRTLLAIANDPASPIAKANK